MKTCCFLNSHRTCAGSFFLRIVIDQMFYKSVPLKFVIHFMSTGVIFCKFDRNTRLVQIVIFSISVYKV